MNTNAEGEVSGVYEIRNIVNGKVYIGSSAKVFRRKRYHCRDLHRGKHGNPHLQNAFSEYGEEAFDFSVLEEVLPEKIPLLRAEQQWMDQTDCCNPNKGYNICKIAGSLLGYKHTAKGLAKIRAANKGKKLSAGTKRKIGATQKGRRPTEESKAKMSTAKKGKKLSAETKAKISAANRGKKHTEETKAKMSAAHKGKKLSAETVYKCSKDWIVVTPEGTFIKVHNLAQFCREHSLNVYTMHEVGAGRKNHYKGWKCRKV